MADSASVSYISGATLEKAQKELFEVPEKRAEAIGQLRENIHNWQPSPDDEHEQNLIFHRQDDDKFLLRFLRAKKFDVERSLQLYVNYHKYRTKYAHLLGNMSVDNEAVKTLLSGGGVCVLPPRTGPRVILIRAGYIDLDTINPGDLVSTLLLVFDRIIETDEDAQVHGIMAIEDLNGFSLFAAMRMSGQEAVRKGVLIELIQESFPARFKGVHFINQPWYFSLVFTIIRPFLKQKLRDRFQIHGTDFESLQNAIPSEYLPQEYSGSLLSADNYTADKLFTEH